MTKPTDVTQWVDGSKFAVQLASARNTSAMRDVLAQLQVVDETSYLYSDKPATGWQEGKLHWYPVGKDLGNAGRIKLALFPENPIAERTINAMESLIELARQLELKKDPGATAPSNPRDAVLRYFDLPRLELVPGMTTPIHGKKPRDYVGDLANRVRVRLIRSKRPVEYAVIVEDAGIGQTPARLHETLLSLGSSEKPDKPYLIGEYGQGGSSAYMACEYSWMVSRRAGQLLEGHDDGVGWTIIKRIIRPNRRGSYWAYLAAHPDGRVPWLPPAAADAIQLVNGTRIAHLAYNFGKSEPTRMLYQALNHLIFDPVLPYELYTRSGAEENRADAMLGNAYRLAFDKKKLVVLDRVHRDLIVAKKKEA